MNERIRELMEQAGFNVMGIWNVIGIEEYHEKFAELIVQECAGIYSRIDNGNLHMGTDNYLEALQKTFFEGTK